MDGSLMVQNNKILKMKNTIILTGFLGSGKTTYLNHILKRNPEKKYAVIENEFGEQSIDSELIIRSSDDIVELNNGCLCCTLNNNLYDILNSLDERKDEFDELIIEATGIADPAGIAEPFIIHPAVKKDFKLDKVICLVDAEQIEDQLKETEEAIKQITFSDVLLINKTDLVSPEYLATLKATLQNINPLSQIIEGNKDNFPDIVKKRSFSLASSSSIHEHTDPTCGRHHESHKDSSQERLFSHSATKHGHHHGDIVSQTFTFKEPFDMELLHHHLYVFLVFQSKDIYRVKGLVHVARSDHQHLIQSVGKRLGIEEKRPWEKDEKKQSTIVFIGKNLQRNGLEKLLTRCLFKG